MSVHKKILDQNKLLLPKKAEESSKWFEQKIKGISTTKPTKNMGNNLVMFNYFPGRESKKTRYHDLFPIVFPIDMSKEGLLGINLHMLSPTHRAFLMDDLKNNYNKPLDVNRKVLSSSPFKSLFSSSVQKYSYNNMRSKVSQLQPDEWSYALFLPFQSKERTR